MLQPPDVLAVLRGTGGRLAVALLVAAAFLIYTNLALAQWTSTEATNADRRGRRERVGVE